MTKEYIIQLRDNSRAVINAKIITCMISSDNYPNAKERILKEKYAYIS